MAQQETAAGTVAGFFNDHADAERAVSALRDAGFTSAHIGVAHRGGDAISGTGNTTGGTVSSTAHAAGQKAEGAWDKFKGFFSGDSAEPYADERQSGDLATREITSADNNQSGYDTTDLHGTMSGLSVPEDRSRYFSHRFAGSDKGAVVTVSAPGREGEARSILGQYGADFGENAADYDYDSADSSRTLAGNAGAAVDTASVQNIQLLGEALRVHKDRISRGEVRLRKEVVTDMQTIQVPVSREELVIERHAATGNTAAAGTIGAAEEIRIPLSEERAGIDKQTFVREEVSVGKRSVEEVRELKDDVRHEELVVEDETKPVTSR